MESDRGHDPTVGPDWGSRPKTSREPPDLLIHTVDRFFNVSTRKRNRRLSDTTSKVLSFTSENPTCTLAWGHDPHGGTRLDLLVGGEKKPNTETRKTYPYLFTATSLVGMVLVTRSVGSFTRSVKGGCIDFFFLNRVTRSIPGALRVAMPEGDFGLPFEGHRKSFPVGNEENKQTSDQAKRKRRPTHCEEKNSLIEWAGPSNFLMEGRNLEWT